jgi:hypothetical protein
MCGTREDRGTDLFQIRFKVTRRLFDIPSSGLVQGLAFSFGGFPCRKHFSRGDRFDQLLFVGLNRGQKVWRPQKTLKQRRGGGLWWIATGTLIPRRTIHRFTDVQVIHITID